MVRSGTSTAGIGVVGVGFFSVGSMTVLFLPTTQRVVPNLGLRVTVLSSPELSCSSKGTTEVVVSVNSRLASIGSASIARSSSRLSLERVGSWGILTEYGTSSSSP